VEKKRKMGLRGPSESTKPGKHSKDGNNKWSGGENALLYVRKEGEREGKIINNLYGARVASQGVNTWSSFVDPLRPSFFVLTIGVRRKKDREGQIV